MGVPHDNPHLKEALKEYPDVIPEQLPWPAGDAAVSWDLKELRLFVGSGGALVPKKKKPTPAAAAAPQGAKPEASSSVGAASAAVVSPANGQQTVPSSDAKQDVAGFENPVYDKERHCLAMLVRVHCEDTAPHGHARLESLAAFGERARSLSLKKLRNLTLSELKEQGIALLITEYVVEIVGPGVSTMDSLRIETRPEFPCPPMFPWAVEVYGEDGALYAHGVGGLNLCQIGSAGEYSTILEGRYKEFIKGMKEEWYNSRPKFSPTVLRFHNIYPSSGVPFKPTKVEVVNYTVRGADCDLYSVLYMGRVPSMMESCLHRYDATAAYVNIRKSVRPGDLLTVHVFTEDSRALFICRNVKEPVLTVVMHYGIKVPVSGEEIRCASTKLPLILKYCNDGVKPDTCADFDFSAI